jgi:hypothetical protein
MASERVSRFFYKWGWDTRCRGLDTISALNGLIGPQTAILDVGCGEYGIATFLRGPQITGTDILDPEQVRSRIRYVPGSIIDLPFGDGEFEIVLAIDVLEHLPVELREKSVHELVRVASKTVVMTYPSSPGGRGVDEDFAKGLERSDQEMPEWLAEHLASPYPDTDEMIRFVGSAAQGRNAEISVIHSERLNNARLVRWAALRSPYLFLAASVLSGFAYRLIPPPAASNAYRTILLARLVGT